MNAYQAASNFVSLYHACEKDAIKLKGVTKFSESDKLVICKNIHDVLRNYQALNTNRKIATLLADHLSKGPKEEWVKSRDRHLWRLNQWMAEYEESIKKVEPKDQVKTAPVKADALAPENGYMKLKQNLMESIKAVCKSAIKHGLNDQEIFNLLVGSSKEAAEEYKVEQNELKLTAFLHTNNITKDTALEIIQRIK